MRVFALVLILTALSSAAVDSEVKRRAVPLDPDVNLPTADGDVDLFDRGLLAGIYLASPATIEIVDIPLEDRRSVFTDILRRNRY